MQLCLLCAGGAEQRISYHMLVVIPGILSLFDLVVSIHAGVPETSWWGTGSDIFCVRLHAWPSLGDCSLFFFLFCSSNWLPPETLKPPDRILNAEKSKSAALSCKYLSSLFTFNWFLYLSSPPFSLLLTWQMLTAPPSQGLHTWLNKSPWCVNAGPAYTLITILHHPFGIFYTNSPQISWLVCVSAFYRPDFVLPCCQRGCFFFFSFFAAELIMLLHLLLTVSFLC